MRLLGIVQDRHVVPRADPFFLRAAASLEILPGDFDDEGPVPLGHVVGGDRGHAADLPLFVPLELHPQERRLEQVEQVQAEPFIALARLRPK